MSIETPPADGPQSPGSSTAIKYAAGIAVVAVAAVGLIIAVSGAKTTAPPPQPTTSATSAVLPASRCATLAGGTTSVTATTLTTTPALLSGSGPFKAVVGPDDNLWFSESGAGKIAVVDPASGHLTEFATSARHGTPLDLVVGPDRRIWFVEDLAIGAITTSGVLSEYPANHPGGIAVGPDHNLWFTELGPGVIGVMGADGTILHQFPIPTPNASRRRSSPVPTTTCGSPSGVRPRWDGFRHRAWNRRSPTAAFTTR